MGGRSLAVLIGGEARIELATMIAHRLGERPSPALLESVWSRAQGNPFFAEELLAEADPAALPTALQAVIIGRVKKLPEQVQSLLAVVAAADAVADHRLLEAVAGLDTEALDAAIGEGIDSQILRRPSVSTSPTCSISSRLADGSKRARSGRRTGWGCDDVTQLPLARQPPPPDAQV